MVKHWLRLTLITLVFAVVFSISTQRAFASFSLFGHEIPTSFSEIVQFALNKGNIHLLSNEGSMNESIVNNEPSNTDQISQLTEKHNDSNNDVNGIDVEKDASVEFDTKSVENTPDRIEEKLQDGVLVENSGDTSITEITIEESTLNNMLRENADGFSMGGYVINEMDVNLEDGYFYVNVRVNESTLLRVKLIVSKDGKSLSVDTIENPSGDISFIKMFILKSVVSKFALSDIQKHLPLGAGEIVKISSKKGSLLIWIKR